jgi:ABC-type phosphate transport system permease subunit
MISKNIDPQTYVLYSLGDIQKCKKEENDKSGKFIKQSTVLFTVSFILAFVVIVFSLLYNYFNI